jgi:hypothetical protein
MKKRYIYFLLLLLFSYSFVSGQTKKDRLLIRSVNNINALNKIKAEASQKFEKQQKEVEILIKQGFPRLIECADGSFKELVGLSVLGRPLYLVSHNQEIVNSLKADVLNDEIANWDDLGPLTGENMEIALWENGQPRPFHELFRIQSGTGYSSRIKYASTPIQNNTINRHATHVAGTLIGNQVDPSASTLGLGKTVRGIAYNSTVRAWDWLDAESEMETAATDGILIGNTSFGYAPMYLHQAEFGRYNETALSWDKIMCSAPYFQIVKSVGNARDDFESIGTPQFSQVTAKGGYDLLEGAGVSKNVLVVGSVVLTDNNGMFKTPPYKIDKIIEPYSSWGCTDDGRIKPDFAVHGNSVISASDQQNNSYTTLSGTSMSAAGLSGGAILIQDYWNKKFSFGFMRSSTLRAILVHSVDDILNPNTSGTISGISDGPDYSYGWGVPNLYKAAQLIKYRGETTIIREEELKNGEKFILYLTANGTQPLIATLAWTDPAGEVKPIDIVNPDASIDEQSSKLVNDLDIKLVRYEKNTDGSELTSPILYPWKLLDNGIAGQNAVLLGDPALRGINNVDNVEKIEVPQFVAYNDLGSVPAQGGLYRLEITHKGNLVNTCEGTGQYFSLVVSGVSMCFHDISLYQNEDNVYNEGVTVKANTISGYNIVKLNENLVEYSAADYIELLPQTRDGESGSEGFTVEGGSNFLAQIFCETNLERDAFSTGDLGNALNDTTISLTFETPVKGVTIYPNPLFNDILNIQFALSQKSNFGIQVYDISGRLLLSKESSNEYEEGTHKITMDLVNLPTGIYVIKTTSKDGLYTIKFIKK